MLAMDSDRQVMPAVEGAVLRIQLDGMIKSLPHIEELTEQSRDPLATQLLARLREARRAASEVEARGQVPPSLVGARL